MPDPGMRDGMLGLFELRFRDMADDLASGRATLGEFQTAMRQELRNLYALQVVAGAGGERSAVSPDDWLALGPKLKRQYEYLAQFAREIKDGNLSAAQISARAALYTRASKSAYWSLVNGDYPVPAQPGDGTVCRCGCEWRFVENPDGSVDAYWERSLEDSCEVCIQRERDWNPYHIAAETA